MPTETASPADVLDATPVTIVLRSAKRRVIAALDLSFLDDWMDNGPGRNPKYPRSQMLRGLLLCTAEMKFQCRELEEYFDSHIGRLICRFSDETPVLSTIWECWNRVQPYIQRVFDRIVQLLDAVGLYGNRFVFDSTHLECSHTDPDGVWMWEPASEEWVYGYGLLVANDCASGEIAGAVVVQRKQHPETATLACFERLVKNTDVTVVLGDSAFDTLEFHERRVDRQILPVCTYNPRNTTEPLDIVFRIEAIAEEYGVQLDRAALRAAFADREWSAKELNPSRTSVRDSTESLDGGGRKRHRCPL